MRWSRPTRTTRSRTAPTSGPLGPRQKFRELFDAPVEVCFVWGGTGANVVSLQSLVEPWDAVVCADTAHIAVDECGAPERFTGCKLLTFPTHRRQAHRRGHRAEPDRSRRRAPLAGHGRLGHAVDGMRHALLGRRAHRALRGRPRARHAGAPRRRPARERGGRAGLRRARADGRRRCRRRQLRRDQERDDVRRGGGLPRSRARRARPVHSQAGHAAAVEDAVRRRPVRGAAHRTTCGWPTPPTRTRWRARSRMPCAISPG